MKKTKGYYQKIYNVETWLGLHTTQLSYTRNLILTFALVSLGYTLSRFQEINDTWQSWIQLTLITIATIFFLISIVFGLFIAIDESENYRLYRKISRKIEQTNTKPEDEFDDSILDDERNQSERIETKNKSRFRRQVWFLFFGIGILSVVLFLRYSHLLTQFN